jgi:neutral ceramidase
VTSANESAQSVSRRVFLGGSVAAVVAASSLAATATVAAAGTSASTTAGTGGLAAGTGLQVGAGKAPISIPASLLPTPDGFTTVHDDLYARVLLLGSGADRFALAVYDLTSINDADAITEIAAIISKAAGVPAANTIVSVTHSFSAPHFNGTSGLTGTALTEAQGLLNQLLAATTAAVNDAVSGLTDARVGYGTGKCDVNVNRNVDTADGWWLGTGEAGPSDKSVRVTRFDDLSGNPIAILANYNVQSSVMMDSVMADGALPITADLAGATVQHVEGQYGSGVVGFFLCGATGDQAPAFVSKRYTIDKDLNWSQVDAHDAGWLLLTVQGERLGTEVVRVSQTIDTAAGANAAVRLITGSITATEVAQTPGQNAAPTKSHAFTPDGTATLPVWVLQVGDGVFVGAEPELSTVTAQAIMDHSPFAHTSVISNLEGGAKNMPDAWNYQHITYESLDSFYAAGTAEAAAAKAAQLLKSLPH